MALKYVNWTTSSCLPCFNQVPAEVILCVPASKTVTGNQTLVAVLEAVTNNCNQNTLTYKFYYDDSQILPGVTLLSSDVLGAFCKDCITTYIDQKVGEAVTVEEPPISAFLAPVNLIDQYGGLHTLPFQRYFELPPITTVDATPFNQPFLAPFLSPGQELNFLMEIDIIARRIGGIAGASGDSGSWKIVVAAKFVAGIVTFIGTEQFLLAVKDQVAMDVMLSISGNLGIITLTGTTDNTFTWVIRIKGSLLETT